MGGIPPTPAEECPGRSGVITLHLQGQAPALVLHIGERNPATTGVYVRLGENSMVALVGALVEWEFDKLFKRLGRAD